MATWMKAELDKLPLHEEVLGKLAGSRILITGATGLVGAYLVHYLMYLERVHKLGLSVIAACRSESKAQSVLGEYFGSKEFSLLVHDIETPLPDSVHADFIIHAGSPADPLSFSTMPVETMLANILGTRNLLEVLRRQGKGRFLYLSTGEVYGELEGVSCKSEEMSGYVDPMNPRSCYPCSKRAGETLCASYGSEYGIEAISARLCYVFGPTITPTNSRADAQFLRKAAAGEDIVMKSAGLQRRSYCYVGDAVTALLTALTLGVPGEAYNIAHPSADVTIREYAETLADIAGVSVVFDSPDAIESRGYSKISHAVLSSEKLLGLGWGPAFSLRESLQMTYHTYKNTLEGSYAGRA